MCIIVFASSDLHQRIRINGFMSTDLHGVLCSSVPPNILVSHHLFLRMSLGAEQRSFFLPKRQLCSPKFHLLILQKGTHTRSKYPKNIQSTFEKSFTGAEALSWVHSSTSTRMHILCDSLTLVCPTLFSSTPEPHNTI